MVASSRGILAIGLGLTGLAILVAPTLGQGQAQDGAVRKAANPASVVTPPTPIAPVIGTVGRLVPVKGQRHLIAALSELSGDTYLAIAGDGPERALWLQTI